jgi:predicted Fe-Mo cluster-binding NifX family protein
VETNLNIPFLAMLVPLFSAFLSYLIAHYENKVGKEINSQSLIANAQESKIDVISSLIIFGGIILAYFNIRYVEGVLGMGLSFMILKIGLQNAKIAVYSLMDANMDKELEDQVLKSMRNIKGVRKVINLKLRQAGLFIFAEADIQLDKNLNVDQAHDIADNIEEKIKNKYKKIENLTVHIEPYEKDEIKILIPVDENGGNLDLRTVNHFGRAKYFLFVVLKNKKIISSYTKKNDFFEKEVRSGLGASKEVLQENIDVLITQRIGEISFHTLHDALVDVYLSDKERSGEAIEDFIAGRLEKLKKATHGSDKE